MAERAGFNESGAPLSPPGALSQRTDMQAQSPAMLPDADYGEQKEFQQIQRGAPMPQQPAAPRRPAPTPLNAPTGRPNEPVTTGVDVGAGLGSEAMVNEDMMQGEMGAIAKYLPQFERMATAPDTPESFRLFVRYLQGFR